VLNPWCKQELNTLLTPLSVLLDDRVPLCFGLSSAQPVPPPEVRLTPASASSAMTAVAANPPITDRNAVTNRTTILLLKAISFIFVSFLLGSFRTYLLVLDWIHSDDISFPPLLLVSVLCEPFACSYNRWISLVSFSDLTCSL
jgi:hypothetical protein